MPSLAMKFILGCFFIVGVPLACALLLQVARKANAPKYGAGLALLILGWVIVTLTALAYIPMIILSFIDERLSKIDEVFGFFVWLIPGISLILTGIRIRRLRTHDSIDKEG
jgi:hypothetical protein